MTTVHKDTEIFAEIEMVEEHFHARERWFGASADQSGTDWALEASLTAFQAISGNGTYGADANDEAKVLGTSDTPVFAGMQYFDFYEILVADVSAGTPYVLRAVWGTGTMAAAITAGQYSMSMVQFDSVNPQLSAGLPVVFVTPRIACGTKVWLQAACGTNDATIDFFVGLHEYAK